METLLLLGLFLGVIGGVAVSAWFYRKKDSRELKEQSIILLEKIKQVCKLITVEGEFSEVFSHRDEKNVFFNLLQLEKKALVIVKAKVLIGFDLTKINIEINSNKKEVKLSRFPEPEILSIETDLEYYDIQKGIISKISENDLTSINKKSKTFIRDKVERSHLMQIARNQANETVLIIRKLIESGGWKMVSEKIIDQFKEREQLHGPTSANN